MPTPEQNIKTAAKLYNCRDTAKRFFKAEYTERLKPYIQIIKTIMADCNLDAIQALIKMSKTKTYKELSGMGEMLFMAAVVEIIEPSSPETPETPEITEIPNPLNQ